MLSYRPMRHHPCSDAPLVVSPPYSSESWRDPPHSANADEGLGSELWTERVTLPRRVACEASLHPCAQPMWSRFSGPATWCLDNRTRSVRVEGNPQPGQKMRRVFRRKLCRQPSDHLPDDQGWEKGCLRAS